MHECRNEKKPDCKGNYRSVWNTTGRVRCDKCGHQVNVIDLKEEQIDHDIKELKENDVRVQRADSE